MKFWDLLYKRYSNPMDLMQNMLKAGKLADFVNDVVNISNKEIEEQTMWDYYLHRVFDMSWDDFRNKTASKPEARTISEERKVEIVKRSLEILNKQGD